MTKICLVFCHFIFLSSDPVPIIPSISTKRLSQAGFGELAYGVMRHVFAIHDEFGRFFDERIYKQELAARLKTAQLEVPVDVIHDSFAKRYFADVVVADGGLFEFKAAETIHPRHRSQTIHYLLLFDLAHGKVMNVRGEEVEHEFVNCQQRIAELRHPTIHDEAWDKTVAGAETLREIVSALISDWGTGLDVSLYEEAVTHFLGGEDNVLSSVSVAGSTGPLGQQRMRLAAPDVAFKITTHPEPDESFTTHTKKLLDHTTSKAIHSINISNHRVTYTTIS